MHMLFKVRWALRAVLYKAIFGAFGLPGYIGPPAFIYGARRIFVGSRVRIFPGLRAECHGDGILELGNEVALGQCCHITCMGKLVIGSGTMITGYVSITDIEHAYEAAGVSVRDQPTRWRETRVGKNCFIGMGARLQAGTVLGDGCVVGANAVVQGVFPDNCVIVGAPGRVVKMYNPDAGQWERQ
ncbi:acyltransferase [Stenotrophomonas rhizophila]